MNRFNLTSKLARITFNLCLAVFIAITILLVHGSILQTAAAQSEHPSGASETDTVYVAPPTGERETDRASILAALEKVEPRGTVQFAPGKYVVGKVIQINIPQITLLGHSDGTILRGCEPDEFAEIEKALSTASNPTEGWAVVSGCGMLELTGGNVTVRNFTFEYTRLGLLLGSSHAEDILYSSEGGYLIEGNTFRNSSNSIRALLASPEPTIIRHNRFMNVFHAFSGAVSYFHILDNNISAPEPKKILPAGHPGFAIALSALVSEDTVTSSCKQNLIAGNQIKGYPDGIILSARQPGAGCQNNVIRANNIEVQRAKLPASWPYFEHYPISDNDSTLVGIPLSLVKNDKPLRQENTFKNNLIEGNQIAGAEGLGIEILNASQNRIINNTITEIINRQPFPGNTLGGTQFGSAANGSGIWISPGSDGNEIVNNTFKEIASAAVFIEGDSNRVEVRSEEDTLRDLGAGNRLTISNRNKEFGHIESRMATVDTSNSAAVKEDARRFMDGYANDLLRHDADAIAARYSRRGTYVVFPGDWNLQPHDSLASMYREEWQGPEAFEWHDLSYEVLSEDAVAVIGGFRFVTKENSGFLGTYTAILVREEGELRIRLENESWDNLLLPGCAAQEWPCDLPLEPTAMERYTGEYEVAGYEDSARIYKEDDSLMIHSPGFQSMRLLYQGSDQFRIADYPAVRLLFEGTGERAERYIHFRGWVLGTGKRVAASRGLNDRELDLSQAALKDTILSLTHDLAVSWTRLEPDNYLARFSDVLIFYFQGSRVDRADFEKIVEETMSSLKKTTFDVKDPEVKILGPNSAVITFRLYETFVDKSENTTFINGMLTLVYERRNEQWQIIRAHESLSGNGESQE